MDNNQLPPQIQLPPQALPPEEKRDEQNQNFDPSGLGDVVYLLPDEADSDSSAAPDGDAPAPGIPAMPAVIPGDAAAPAELPEGLVSAADGTDLAAAAADGTEAAAAADGSGVLDAIGQLGEMVSQIELPDIGGAIGSLLEGIGDLLP